MEGQGGKRRRSSRIGQKTAVLLSAVVRVYACLLGRRQVDLEMNTLDPGDAVVLQSALAPVSARDASLSRCRVAAGVLTYRSLPLLL